SPLIALGYSTARQGLGALAPEVRYSGPSDPGPTIDADQAQLQQVLVILFENALLALAESNGDKEIRGSVSSSADRVELVIEDSGPGIPPEIAGRLFQPFITGRKRGAPRPGTGLGLATARRIVERHQGGIRVERSALGGARFVISLVKEPRIEAGP